MFFRVLTFFLIFGFSNNVFAAQNKLFNKYYIQEDLKWHVETHEKIKRFTKIDTLTQWNPESRNIAFIRIKINNNEALKPVILFYSGGKKAEVPKGKGVQRVNVFSYIPQNNLEEWAKYIKEFLNKYSGVEANLKEIQEGFVTHSEIAIFMYLIKENLLSQDNNIIIDIASKRDACMLQCSNFLNGFVTKNKNIIIRFSGGMADQSGTNRDTRDNSIEKNKIRYQVYTHDINVTYNSGVFNN